MGVSLKRLQQHPSQAHQTIHSRRQIQPPAIELGRSGPCSTLANALGCQIKVRTDSVAVISINPTTYLFSSAHMALTVTFDACSRMLSGEKKACDEMTGTHAHEVRPLRSLEGWGKESAPVCCGRPEPRPLDHPVAGTCLAGAPSYTLCVTTPFRGHGNDTEARPTRTYVWWIHAPSNLLEQVFRWRNRGPS